jgi:iron-sulfur cluster repair protein YtfE (RIC family)
VENVSTGGAREESLHRALEQEHREIDAILEGYADGPAPGPEADADLGRAVAELRRHIYAEEELLFPPLRQAGMIGPVMVMLREHGQMWPILDRLDQGLVEEVGADVLGADCRELLALLQLHNPKEEQILYPELDRVVGEDTGADVHELLDAGQVPAGWTCQFLRAEHGRR